MTRFLALSVIVLPVLALGLTAPQPAQAQGGLDSLYDTAPGVKPPPGARNRDGDRERNRGGRRDDDGGLREGDPELENMLDQLDRRSRGGRPDDRRRDRDPDRDRNGMEPLPGDRDLDREPPRRREREREEPEDPTFKRTERDAPATGKDGSGDPTFKRVEPDLGHKVIAGLWTGTVEEVGADPYTLRLSLNEDGTGSAAYSKPNCASEIIPIAGRLMEYRETITMGRGDCDDGTVQLRLRRGLLLWTWKDDKGEVRAAATLKRSIKPAAGDGARENDADKRRVIGDGVVTPPPATTEEVVE